MASGVRSQDKGKDSDDLMNDETSKNTKDLASSDCCRIVRLHCQDVDPMTPLALPFHISERETIITSYLS
jgi:hypothetical protein